MVPNTTCPDLYAVAGAPGASIELTPDRTWAAWGIDGNPLGEYRRPADAVDAVDADLPPWTI